jgi:putative MATE family efflux protein
MFNDKTILKRMFKIGFPSLTGFFFYNIYMLINMMWVAKLGKESVAAIGLFGSIFFIFSAINEFGGSSSVPLISKKFGEKNYKRAGEVIVESIYIKILTGAISICFAFFLLKPILSFISNGNSELTLIAVKFGTPLLIFLPFAFIKYSVLTSFRCIEKSNYAMYLLTTEVILNIILDPILIFGFGFIPAIGIYGPGVALIISQLIVIIIGLVILSMGLNNIKINLFKYHKISKDYKKYLVKTGVPATCNSVLNTLSIPIIMKIVSSYGTDIVAIFSVMMQLVQAFISVLIGFGLGISSLIGILNGENDRFNLKKTASIFIKLSTSVYIIICSLIAVFSAFIVKLYVKNISLESFTIAKHFIILTGVLLFFEAIKATLMYIFGGTGQTKYNMISNVSITWLFFIPGLLILKYHFNSNIYSIVYFLLLSKVIVTFFMMYYYKKEKWLQSI